MSDIKTKAAGIDPSIICRDVNRLAGKTGTIYETLAIISMRARQISNDTKFELNAKLNEFAVPSETIEEVMENKEQIEISKFYEKLPNPAILATEEFIRGDIHYRFKDDAAK